MGSSKASATCGVCGTDLLLYKCKYCGQVYCEKHRRPQDHKCSGMAEYRQQLEAGIAIKPGVQTAPPAEAPEAKAPVSSRIVKGGIMTVKVLSIVAIVAACIIALVMLIGFFYTQSQATYASLPVKNTTGAQIVLINNRSAADPTYDQLVQFLKADDTSSLKYTYPNRTCADFAKRLHDNAEAKGIKAAFVGVEFYNGSVDYTVYDDGSGSFSPPAYSPDMGHGLNLFNTTDKGPVYVDASSLYEGSTGDRVAYVVEGREFNEIDLSYATSPDYSFYTSYKEKYLNYLYELKEYNRLAKNYNQGIAEPGMELSQMALVLSSRSDTLATKKAGIGPFYYPFGTVKTINIYW